jgi:translation elongation factor EF-Ts
MVIHGNNVSVAIRLDEDGGDVSVVVGIHCDDEETAWVDLTSEVAAQIALALTARAVEARALEKEIAAIPEETKQSGLQLLWQRLNSQMN